MLHLHHYLHLGWLSPTRAARPASRPLLESRLSESWIPPQLSVKSTQWFTPRCNLKPLRWRAGLTRVLVLPASAPSLLIPPSFGCELPVSPHALLHSSPPLSLSALCCCSVPLYAHLEPGASSLVLLSFKPSNILHRIWHTVGINIWFWKEGRQAGGRDLLDECFCNTAGRNFPHLRFAPLKHPGQESPSRGSSSGSPEWPWPWGPWADSPNPK